MSDSSQGDQERFIGDLSDLTPEEPKPKPLGRPRKDGKPPRQRPKVEPEADRPKEDGPN